MLNEGPKLLVWSDWTVLSTLCYISMPSWPVNREIQQQRNVLHSTTTFTTFSVFSLAVNMDRFLSHPWPSSCDMFNAIFILSTVEYSIYIPHPTRWSNPNPSIQLIWSTSEIEFVFFLISYMYVLASLHWVLLQSNCLYIIQCWSFSVLRSLSFWCVLSSFKRTIKSPCRINVLTITFRNQFHRQLFAPFPEVASSLALEPNLTCAWAHC